jgi:sporulation-control protein spo0M
MVHYSVNPEIAQKILRSVPYVQGFHFFTQVGSYTGETAISLLTFSKEIKAIDAPSLSFHLQRGDFQKWIATTLGDAELAERINKINTQQPDENIRSDLLQILQARLEELQAATQPP